MVEIRGAGCWPGRAEGRVVWLDRGARPERVAVANRAAELIRFRGEWERAVVDIEQWVEQQTTLAGRLLLTPYQDALLDDAWSQRTCALINNEGLDAATAITDAATQIGNALRRSPALRERAGCLVAAARWLARRFLAEPLPPDAIIAAQELLPLELLDLRRPAIVAGAEPPVTGSVPLVWGVAGIGPDWNGRRVALEGERIRLDIPERPHWTLHGDRLGDWPVFRPDGELAWATDIGRAVLIERLDDLAAAPLIAGRAVAIAVDLERLAIVTNLKHPGVQRLLAETAQAAAEAGIPALVGGAPALADPEAWLALGFSGLLHKA